MPSGFGGMAQVSFNVALISVKGVLREAPIVDRDRWKKPLCWRSRSMAARASDSSGATAFIRIELPSSCADCTATSGPSNSLRASRTCASL
jgi:hypothetical protein